MLNVKTYMWMYIPVHVLLVKLHVKYYNTMQKYRDVLLLLCCGNTCTLSLSCSKNKIW